MPDPCSRVRGYKSSITGHRSLVTSLACILIVFSVVLRGAPLCHTPQAKKPLTVADEIGLALFSYPEGGSADLLFSPDENYFFVKTEQGHLEQNCVEDAVRVYRTQSIKEFLDHPESSQPSTSWIITRTGKEGSVIDGLRWLGDSSGVVFLERLDDGNQRLVLADIRQKTIEPLTSSADAIGDFDIRDRNHYVYTAADPSEKERLRDKMRRERQSSAIVGTGRYLDQLLFADDSMVRSAQKYLWAVVGGKRFEVKHDGALLVPGGSLALSPDGNSLVATLPVPEVPPSWEKLYPPLLASYPFRIRARSATVRQYVRIDLKTGSTQVLTDAPAGYEAGWETLGGPTWSSDGQEILLPGTFLATKDHSPSRPCVAVVDLASNTRTCVEMLKGHTQSGVEEGYHLIDSVRFVEGDKGRVLVTFHKHEDFSSLGTIEYQRTAVGTWKVARHSEGVCESRHGALEVVMKQGLNEPPLLVATNKERSRIIWDPNPQLKNIDLGQASIYRWKDKEGREWKGGLYKPVDYKPGARYPLVIQTHSFFESEFRPSGMFATAFAARALAAAGIVVVQVQDLKCMTMTPYEGPCAVSGYESLATQLASEGMVDPERIGIIGFSRTCYYVMETLTTTSLHLKAASITDGVMADYIQYMTEADRFGNAFPHQFNSMIGAQPFAEGLQQWLKRSPGFNLNKVNAPLLVNAEGPSDVLFMWGPYAGLRYLHKPVDLILLNTDEHVLTNPAVRMASQGGSIDWFRFWLKGEEDPNPAKLEQYARWHELRKLQEGSENKSNAAQAALGERIRK
jgi:dipeptidyl aminopeptidase/acylaminoacyl peptidase